MAGKKAINLLRKLVTKKTGGFKYESKIIFKGFYIGGHRSDHFFVRQCDNPVCAAAVFIKFDRFIGALRNGYGMRVYSGYFAVAPSAAL